MNDSLHDNQISVIEDLSPEISQRKSISARREALLGLILLAGVFGWAGWQWWQQETLSSSYRSGQDAASNRRWDQALDLFTQASGYRDADRRAVETRMTIEKRDQAYKGAKAHALTGEWAACLEAVQTVEGIEPAYKDTGTLSAEALRNVLAQSSEGSIAARSGEGQPAGLYYRSANAWQRLDYSDAQSQLINDSVSDKQARYVLYDAPGVDAGAPVPKGVPPAATSPAGTSSTGAAPAGRKLAVAAPWLAAFHTELLTFDPASYNFFVSGAKGVYAFAARQKGWSSVFPAWSSPYLGYSAFYQALDGSTASPIVLPGDDWIIADIGQARGFLLLARSEGAEHTGRETSLYIAGSDGANPRFIYSYSGGLHSALFSPDGSKVLATTYQALPDGRSEEVSIVLLSPWSDTPARVLARKVTTDTNREFFKALGAAFLRKGANRMLVLVGDIGLRTSTLTLVDTQFPDAPLSKVTVSGTPYRLFSADDFYMESSILLVWQTTPSNISAGGSDVISVLEMPLVGAVGAARLLTLRDPARQVLTGTWVRDNKLVYSSYSLEGDPKQPRYFSLSSLPLVDLASSGAKSATVYLSTVPAILPFSPQVSPNWYPGSRLLSYVAQGMLRAKTYDGRVDLPVEEGISGLYFLQVQSWINLK